MVECLILYTLLFTSYIHSTLYSTIYSTILFSLYTTLYYTPLYSIFYSLLYYTLHYIIRPMTLFPLDEQYVVRTKKRNLERFPRWHRGGKNVPRNDDNSIKNYSEQHSQHRVYLIRSPGLHFCADVFSAFKEFHNYEYFPYQCSEHY